MVPRTRAFVLAFSWSIVAHADALRLEDAVRFALQNNERSHKAPLRVEAARGQLDRARDAFFPTLGANAAATYRPDVAGRTTAANGTLTLTQPLLNPSAFVVYSQQKHQVESERWGGAGRGAARS